MQDVFAVEFEGQFRVVDASTPLNACIAAARKFDRDTGGEFVLVGDTYQVTSLCRHETSEVFVSKDVLLQALNQ